MCVNLAACFGGPYLAARKTSVQFGEIRTHFFRYIPCCYKRNVPSTNLLNLWGSENSRASSPPLLSLFVLFVLFVPSSPFFPSCFSSPLPASQSWGNPTALVYSECSKGCILQVLSRHREKDFSKGDLRHRLAAFRFHLASCELWYLWYLRAVHAVYPSSIEPDPK